MKEWNSLWSSVPSIFHSDKDGTGKLLVVLGGGGLRFGDVPGRKLR